MSRLILVTGAEGMLGREVVRTLRERLADIYNVNAVNRRQLDITDPKAVCSTVPGHALVINCAAWTDVDSAELPENRSKLYDVNCTGPALLATVCQANTSKLIHISTDYVFGGSQQTWPYDESSLTLPVNAYGASKACGEREVLLTMPVDGYVLRTSWLYGSKGFVPTMLRAGLQNRTVKVTVPKDQVGSPTSVTALATRIAALSMVVVAGRSVPSGVYHASASGCTTRFELARRVFELAGLNPNRVRGVTTEDLTDAAVRPRYSVLDQQRWAAAGIKEMPSWESMLEESLPKLMTKIRTENSMSKSLRRPRVGV